MTQNTFHKFCNHFDHGVVRGKNRDNWGSIFHYDITRLQCQVENATKTNYYSDLGGGHVFATGKAIRDK